MMTNPLPNETEVSFTERCHADLGTGMETDDKQAQCFQQWRSVRGETPIERKAIQRFSNDQFMRVRDVPIFAEHTTRDRDGDVVVYDRNALAAIAQRCNDRIHDTGDFSPITDGHTPDKAQAAAGAAMPDVLGYSGPYRLGKIGNKTPRWAIFTDEWWHREDADRLRKLRRRSPEVWLEERMEDRFFDPIAALGAETPRLDMGMTRFARRFDGQVVEKYTATFPGAMTVSPKSDDLNKKKKYGVNPWVAAGLGALAGSALKSCPPCPGQGRFRTSYEAGADISEGSAIGVLNVSDWVRRHLPNKHPSDAGLGRLLSSQGVPTALVPQSIAEVRKDLELGPRKYDCGEDHEHSEDYASEGVKKAATGFKKAATDVAGAAAQRAGQHAGRAAVGAGKALARSGVKKVSGAARKLGSLVR